MNERVLTVFIADIRWFREYMSANTRVDSDFMDGLEALKGKEVADAFRQYVFSECEKHDMQGLLEGILTELHRILGGVRETIKIDMNGLREQLHEDE